MLQQRSALQHSAAANELPSTPESTMVRRLTLLFGLASVESWLCEAHGGCLMCLRMPSRRLPPWLFLKVSSTYCVISSGGVRSDYRVGRHIAGRRCRPSESESDLGQVPRASGCGSGTVTESYGGASKTSSSSCRWYPGRDWQNDWQLPALPSLAIRCGGPCILHWAPRSRPAACAAPWPLPG